ncbi:hypothetical protein QJS04_geneDACA007185 [Acorus gramineus]|uniref:Uncharacterized protein n=1 Tax=Acorus gramineus TaxID=55184 RepID=A0AAV9BN60_ACOGR|nr:hypothetical protein QJS04_geneDACA007185 [Acorus gramineus]
MEVSAITDLSVQFQTLTIARFLLPRQSCSISSTDAVAPPPVRSTARLSPAPSVAQTRRRRGKRRRPSTSEPDDGSDDGFFFGGGGGADGPSGGGGGGWSSGGGGGWNWGEDPPPSRSDPVFEFFYEVLCWIVLSNISHVAFKKFARLFEDGIADPSREKVVSMC